MYKCAILLASVMAVPSTSFGLPTSEVPTSEPEYLAKVKTAAPPQIVAKSTITMPQKDGAPKVLQTGTNGFTCYINADGTPVCADQNALEWAAASRAKAEPPNKVGFMYMLAGDTGANNEAPGTGKHEHWVQTGPHVMIVGPVVKDMPGYSRAVDVVDPTQPYVMHLNTPYAHLMIPATDK